jgi:integrase
MGGVDNMDIDKKQAPAWIDPKDVASIANNITRKSIEARDRDSAIIRLLADIGLRPGEIADDTPVVTVDDVNLSTPTDGNRLATTALPTSGAVVIRSEVAAVRQRSDAVVRLQDPMTAMVLYRHLLTIDDDSSPGDPLFTSTENETLSKHHVREMVSNAAKTANVQPQTIDDVSIPDDVTPLMLRHTAAYRRLQAGGALTPSLNGNGCPIISFPNTSLQLLKLLQQSSLAGYLA